VRDRHAERDQCGIGNRTVARAWRSYGIKPWKAESFRFSTDPELVGKVTDICGLYLGTNQDIPANAIVLSIDEKSQIQALDRTVPILPMQPGKVERRSHDYYRHAVRRGPCDRSRRSIGGQFSTASR
jgi:hypothetical protein